MIARIAIAAILGLMAGGIIVLAAVVLTLKVNDDAEPVVTSQPTPGPDIVVGIEPRCEVLAGGQLFHHRGTTCSALPPSGSAVFTDQQELTIRTSLGTTYTVRVSLDTAVKLGHTWPP